MGVLYLCESRSNKWCHCPSSWGSIILTLKKDVSVSDHSNRGWTDISSSAFCPPKKYIISCVTFIIGTVNGDKAHWEWNDSRIIINYYHRWVMLIKSAVSLRWGSSSIRDVLSHHRRTLTGDTVMKNKCWPINKSLILSESLEVSDFSFMQASKIWKSIWHLLSNFHNYFNILFSSTGQGLGLGLCLLPKLVMQKIYFQ